MELEPPLRPFLSTMGNRRSGRFSGPSSTSASGRSPGSSATKKGKPEINKASSTRKFASTDNQENSGITAEHWAAYKSTRTQAAAKKKAEIAANDEGMSSIFIVAMHHNYFY